MLILKKKTVNRYFNKTDEGNWFCQIEYYNLYKKYTVTLEKKGLNSREDAEDALNELLDMVRKIGKGVQDAIKQIEVIEKKLS